MANSIRYIRDKKGNKKEVVVPIKLWERLKALQKNNGRRKLSKDGLTKYWGTIRLTVDPLQYQRTSREN